MCVSQKWPNLEKRPPFPQFSSKLSEFFFVKDLTNQGFFYKLKAFKGILFWLGGEVWKMDDLFQRPPRAYFYQPQLLKKKFGESCHLTVFTKKCFEKFWWNFQAYKPYPYPVGHFGPPPLPPLQLMKVCGKLFFLTEKSITCEEN